MKNIKSIGIKNSPFFEDVEIKFSKKLTCIMGGRGTGKSTLLYFARALLCPNAEEEITTYNILKSNLGTGELKLEIEGVDDVAYSITKTFGDDPQPYKLPSSEYIPLDKIVDDLECDFYETGKIEKIGRSRAERLSLLDKKIKLEIQEYKVTIKKIQIDLDANARDIKTFNQRLLQIDEFVEQYEGIETDFEAQKQQQPAGLREKEKKEFEEADIREKVRKDERRFFNKSTELFNQVRIDFEAQKGELIDTYEGAIEDKNSFINVDVMGSAMSNAVTALNSIQEHIDAILELLEKEIENLEEHHTTISMMHDVQQAEFVKLKQKYETNREYFNKYHTLSKKLNEKITLLKDHKDLTKKRGKLKTQRKTLIQKLNNLKQSIFKIRLDSINELNEGFEGMIIINLTYAGITDEFEEKLRQALKGSGMRYNELIPRIVENFSTDEFAEAIHEKDIDRLKSIAGIDDARSNALVNALFETDGIYEIERMYCDDLPEFKLRIYGGERIEENYRSSDELSMGQRCTTVLPIIFAVSNNPLIIDQPEDNLDNKYISEQIHKIIRQQKSNRQLIFITHNPNIPVLSEAEHNIFLTYNRKATVDAKGTVDNVKNNIIELLEGGEEAFKTRMGTYGY